MTLFFYQSDIFWAINVPLILIVLFIGAQFYYDWKERKVRKVKRIHPVILNDLLKVRLDADQKLN